MKNLIFIFACLFLAVPCQAKTIFVDADASGANDGTSWENAYNYLHKALSDAHSLEEPFEIRVAQGVYKPDEGISAIPDFDWRLLTFKLINGVTLKGGYAGFGEPDPNARDIELYKTILSGDLNGNDREVDDPCDLFSDPCRAENSYHVVIADDPSIGQSTVLDGFTITNGNATRSDDYGLGGGIYCRKSSPTIRDCVIKRNAAHSGGGMFNEADYDSHCYPTLIDCTFSGNSALVFGGGMFNYIHCHPKLINCTFRGNSTGISGGGMSNYWYSHPKLTNCAFYDNHAESFYGGGMDNFVGCNPKMTNCMFSHNSSGDEGGGLYNDMYCDPELINCTFSRNESATYGGGMCNYSYCNPEISNCIFWDNEDAEGQGEDSQIRWGAPVINYSCVEGWTGDLGGAGNIDDAPCFADSANEDLHLQSAAGRWDANSRSWVQDNITSPCIDAGNPGCPVGDEPNDPNNVRINMGAYGGTTEASKSPANWRSIADMTNDWIVDSNDLKVFVDYWLETGECIPSDLNRSQSVDFSDFAIFGQNWSYPSASEPGITYQIEDCDQEASGVFSAEPPDLTRFTVTVEDLYIHFEDMMVANCCPDGLGLEMTVEDNLITIYETEYTPGICLCICEYPVTATLGPFEPGTYILEVYEDWGGFIGSTTVVIDPPQ